MYCIAGGDVERYGTRSSYVSLDFSTSDGESVGACFRAWGKGFCRWVCTAHGNYISMARHTQTQQVSKFVNSLLCC